MYYRMLTLFTDNWMKDPSTDGILLNDIFVENTLYKHLLHFLIVLNILFYSTLVISLNLKDDVFERTTNCKWNKSTIYAISTYQFALMEISRRSEINIEQEWKKLKIKAEQ